jgi:protocatechuate 3,4-dioxygenase beta subunit
MDGQRRRLLVTAGTAGLLTLAGPATANLLTPRQSAGPFYPDEPLLDDDSDLVHVAGRDDVASGEITDLRGRLLDLNGRPLQGTRIEIWQCDANGRYRHSRDPGQRAVDPAFQGLGHSVSDAEGHYRFLTIRPVPYPGRTPHIHVAVYPAGDKPFVTQLYVAGEPRNDGDFLYRRIPSDRRHLVTADFVATEQGRLRADWDLFLGVSPAA